MVTVWWSAAGLIHYTFLNPSETITSEKCAQQINEMHQKLKACSWHWSTEWTQFFSMTMPNHMSHKQYDYCFIKDLDNFLQGKCFHNQKAENAFQSLKSQSTDFYITEINVGKNVLIVMVPILINKDVFEPTYNDLKFTAQNYIYFCTNLIYLVSNVDIRSESHTLSQKRVMLTALIVGIKILELT